MRAGFYAGNATIGCDRPVDTENVIRKNAVRLGNVQGLSFGHRIGVAVRGRNVVDDVDGQRAVIVVAVHVGNANGEAVGVVDAVGRVLRQRIGVRDGAGVGVISVDRDEPVVAVEGLTDRARDDNAINGHQRRCITRGEVDRAAGYFGCIAVVAGDAVRDLARTGGKT